MTENNAEIYKITLVFCDKSSQTRSFFDFFLRISFDTLTNPTTLNTIIISISSYFSVVKENTLRKSMLDKGEEYGKL